MEVFGFAYWVLCAATVCASKCFFVIIASKSPKASGGTFADSGMISETWYRLVEAVRRMNSDSKHASVTGTGNELSILNFKLFSDRGVKSSRRIEYIQVDVGQGKPLS